MAEEKAKPAEDDEPLIEVDRETPEDWTPNVLAFACHYCAFAAADLAGWILADGLDVRLGMQLHKMIWPDQERGV